MDFAGNHMRLLRAIPVALLRILIVALVREASHHDYDASSKLLQQYDFVISKWRPWSDLWRLDSSLFRLIGIFFFVVFILLHFIDVIS